MIQVREPREERMLRIQLPERGGGEVVHVGTCRVFPETQQARSRRGGGGVRGEGQGRRAIPDLDERALDSRIIGAVRPSCWGVGRMNRL